MLVFARKIRRLSLFTGATAFFLLLGVVINLPLSGSVERRTLRRARATMLWSRTLCRILGIRVSPEGEVRELPGSLTVSTHISYADIFVLGSLRPTLFVSKQEVSRWPVLGRLARMAGTVFINRESKRSAWEALEEVERRLGSGPTVVIFPEGTTTSGREVLEFKGFFFMIPLRGEVPVRPLSIRYSTSAEGDCPVAWYGGMGLLPHAWRLLGIERIEARVYHGPAITGIGTDAGAAEARRILTSSAAESVRDGLSRLGSL